jgi:aminoglycoside 3-N-acetyltransferase
MMNAIKHEGNFRPDEFIRSFTGILKNGNLFIPGFVNTLKNGDVVDMRSLKPETGGLSKESFGQFKKGMCVRTNDPFHSFFIYGKDANEIVESTFNNRDTFGSQSVFGYLHRRRGILLIMDLELYYGFTFAHYVEQQIKAGYRMNTSYHFKFTDVKGNISNANFNIYAKKRGYIPVLNSLLKPLLEEQALEIINVNQVQIYRIDLEKAFRILESDILNNKARNLIDFSLSLYLKQTVKKIAR